MNKKLAVIPIFLCLIAALFVPVNAVYTYSVVSYDESDFIADSDSYDLLINFSTPIDIAILNMSFADSFFPAEVTSVTVDFIGSSIETDVVNWYLEYGDPAFTVASEAQLVGGVEVGLGTPLGAEVGTGALTDLSLQYWNNGTTFGGIESIFMAGNATYADNTLYSFQNGTLVGFSVEQISVKFENASAVLGAVDLRVDAIFYNSSTFTTYVLWSMLPIIAVVVMISAIYRKRY